MTTGINQWNKYKDNGESIFLAIQGQVEPSLWDKTKDDARFPAIQALKCPIALINLMKERCTGGTAGTWEPLAFIKQLDKTISYSQCPPRGGNSMTIGEYKRTVESYVSTTCKLGGLLAFGSTLMEPILAAPQPGVTTLLAYVRMTEVLRRPYDILYKDLIVTIIMTKGCNYSSLRKWLAQNHLIPGSQAYTMVSNELVDMVNSNSFQPDASKQKPNKNKNKKNDDETMGAIIMNDQPSSEGAVNDVPVESETEPTDNIESESEDSDSNNSVASSDSEESSEESTMVPSAE